MRAAASTCGLRRTHMRTRPVLPRRLHANVRLTYIASLHCCVCHPGTKNGALLIKQILLYTAMSALHASVAQGESVDESLSSTSLPCWLRQTRAQGSAAH